MTDKTTDFFIERCKSETVKNNQLIFEATNHLHALGLRRCWQGLAKLSEKKI